MTTNLDGCLKFDKKGIVLSYYRIGLVTLFLPDVNDTIQEKHDTLDGKDPEYYQQNYGKNLKKQVADYGHMCILLR